MHDLPTASSGCTDAASRRPSCTRWLTVTRSGGVMPSSERRLSTDRSRSSQEGALSLKLRAAALSGAGAAGAAACGGAAASVQQRAVAGPVSQQSPAALEGRAVTSACSQ